MNRINQFAIDIARAAINKENLILAGITADDWPSIYKILSIGKLIGVTYSTVSKLPPNLAPPIELLNQWKQQSFHYGIRQILANKELSYVLKEAKARNINLIVFKGLPIANLYPEMNSRFTSDADLFVSPEERTQAEAMLVELGYKYMEPNSKESVPVYSIKDQNRSLFIELHSRLWEDYEGEQTRQLDKLKLTDKDSLITVRIDHIELVTLGYEEHLIYQMFHIIKHFAFEGVCLRYLTDITLYINAYIKNIDLPHFWNIMKLLKYDIFCDSFFKVCVKYLGLTPDILQPDYNHLEVNYRLIEDFFTCGISKDDNKEKWLAVEMILPYFMGENQLANSNTKKKIAMFFPSPNDLKEKFSYAKKHKFLLPIAWIHRFTSGLFYARYCKIHGNSASKIIKKAHYRLELLKEVGLIKTKS
jgi:hypothetical protein